MPHICYVGRRFKQETLDRIEQANEIIRDYTAQGFDLTLRQLYYQLVARAIIPNNLKEYNKLKGVVNNARLAGLIDWKSIVDRTRELKQKPSWDNPADIVDACSRQFRYDKWASQPYRLEVWIEKDALTGVIKGVCDKMQVPYFSCRGYTSQSEMWVAAQRLMEHCEADQEPYILHLGDHDPSGIDMSRDIQDRLTLFMTHHGYNVAGYKRLALNMDQVDEYDPPPNPAKTTDSRYEAYISEHGEESWELDALEPKVLVDLIRKEILRLRDNKKWQAELRREKEARESLRFAAQNWERIQFIAGDGDWHDDAWEDYLAEQDEDEDDGDGDED